MNHAWKAGDPRAWSRSEPYFVSRWQPLRSGHLTCPKGTMGSDSPPKKRYVGFSILWSHHYCVRLSQSSSSFLFFPLSLIKHLTPPCLLHSTINETLASCLHLADDFGMIWKWVWEETWCAILPLVDYWYSSWHVLWGKYLIFRKNQAITLRRRTNIKEEYLAIALFPRLRPGAIDPLLRPLMI